MSTEPVYQVRNLSHAYGTQPALRDVTLTIQPGDMAVVAGPNGAGKSTLVRILGRLLGGFSGRVTFCGRPLNAWPAQELARRVAYVPQQAQVVFPFTAREVVLMGRLPHQRAAFFETERDREIVRACLEQVDVDALAQRPFGELSGGERQRVVLASALAQEPRVLLLDEPTVFLDLKHRVQFGHILRDLHKRQGLTLVLVTHDLDFAASLGTRLFLFKEGALRATSSRGRDGHLSLTAEMVTDVFDVPAVQVEHAGHRSIVVSFDP